ncbi:hypothetical protein KVR01_011356 [Diaporthe batatas]|uniref:uncharacterized protein n=1 Tax=Diaporthe batatas TaxID=748121 RepID=UPI001D048A49|nr:uncharacterized protein KVR01_011356 [Diaporthe batatas]KAG8158913.1 hypothetical protein KVR01_011356 [Diaporthe batatas]
MEPTSKDEKQAASPAVAANEDEKLFKTVIHEGLFSTGAPPPAPPFSVFTRGQKRWISWMAAFGAMFSTLNSFIYFPAVVPMARDLNVSVSLINLTITCYLIVAGLAPAVMGDLADHDGRRPVYILMFVLMLGANIGLAVQDSYPALFVLRMIQSAGSSGTFGAANGVISDVASVAERGSYTGTLILFTNTAPSFGPVLSGVLAEFASWRWIFWFLTILVSCHGVLLILFFPETQRKLVGNGSRRVHGFLYQSLFWKVTKQEHVLEKKTQPEERVKRKAHIPNPLACVPMLFEKGSFCTMFLGGVNYAVKMTIQASLGSQCISIYNLNYLEAGLIYLPAGVSGGLGAKFTGQFLDWTDLVFRTDKRMCIKLDGSFQRGEDISDFPIEKVRLKGAYTLLMITAIGTAGYGLALMTRTHISVMLILQFIISFTTSSIIAIYNTLLTDLNVSKAATVRGASNLVRCVLAGAFIAALEPLAQTLGLGWCFGVFAILQLFSIPPVWLLNTHGRRWREERAARNNECDD